MLRQGIIASSPNNFLFREDAGFVVVVAGGVVDEEDHLLHGDSPNFLTSLSPSFGRLAYTLCGWAANKRAATTMSFLVGSTRLGIVVWWLAAVKSQKAGPFVGPKSG